MASQSQPKIEKLAEPEFGRPKRFMVWMNGQFYGNGEEVSISPKYLRTWNAILMYITNVTQPKFGAIRTLYSLETRQVVQSFKDVVPNGKYIAAGHEKLKYKKGAYLTPAEQEIQFRKTLTKSPLYSNPELRLMSNLSMVQRKYNIIFFLMTSGRTSSPPIKIVLTNYDKNIWSRVIFEYFAYRLDIPEGIQYICTIYGKEVVRLDELQHGYVYVAVPFGEKFTRLDYMSIFQEYLPQLMEKRSNKKKKKKKYQKSSESVDATTSSSTLKGESDGMLYDGHTQTCSSHGQLGARAASGSCAEGGCGGGAKKPTEDVATQTSDFMITDEQIIMGSKRYVFFNQNVGIIPEMELRECAWLPNTPAASNPVDLLVNISTQESLLYMVDAPQDTLTYQAKPGEVKEILLHLNHDTFWERHEEAVAAHEASKTFLPVEDYISNAEYNTQDGSEMRMPVESYVTGIEANVVPDKNIDDPDGPDVIKLRIDSSLKSLSLKLGLPSSPTQLQRDRGIKNTRSSVELYSIRDSLRGASFSLSGTQNYEMQSRYSLEKSEFKPFEYVAQNPTPKRTGSILRKVSAFSEHSTIGENMPIVSCCKRTSILQELYEAGVYVPPCAEKKREEDTDTPQNSTSSDLIKDELRQTNSCCKSKTPIDNDSYETNSLVTDESITLSGSEISENRYSIDSRNSEQPNNKEPSAALLKAKVCCENIACATANEIRALSGSKTFEKSPSSLHQIPEELSSNEPSSALLKANSCCGNKTSVDHSRLEIDSALTDESSIISGSETFDIRPSNDYGDSSELKDDFKQPSDALTKANSCCGNKTTGPTDIETSPNIKSLLNPRGTNEFEESFMIEVGKNDMGATRRSTGTSSGSSRGSAKKTVSYRFDVVDNESKITKRHFSVDGVEISPNEISSRRGRAGRAGDNSGGDRGSKKLLRSKRPLKFYTLPSKKLRAQHLQKKLEALDFDRKCLQCLRGILQFFGK